MKMNGTHLTLRRNILSYNDRMKFSNEYLLNKQNKCNQYIKTNKYNTFDDMNGGKEVIMMKQLNKNILSKNIYCDKRIRKLMHSQSHLLPMNIKDNKFDIYHKCQPSMKYYFNIKNR